MLPTLAIATFLVLPAFAADELSSRANLDFALDAGAEPDVIPVAAPRYGAAGSTRWSVQAGIGFNFETASEMLPIGGIGIEHYVADDISLEAQLNGFAAHQEGPDAAAIHLGLLFRWHAWRGDDWTFFIDGGGGLSYATENIPATGSEFNFTPQAGFGVSFALPDDARLLLGLKWFHVSNANTRESNPGLDNALFWAGLSWPF